jgi:hypothetical protein
MQVADLHCPVCEVYGLTLMLKTKKCVLAKRASDLVNWKQLQTVSVNRPTEY